MSMFKLINLQSNQLEFFRQDFHPDVFGQAWLIFENEYRSATATPVEFKLQSLLRSGFF